MKVIDHLVFIGELSYPFHLSMK